MTPPNDPHKLSLQALADTMKHIRDIQHENDQTPCDKATEEYCRKLYPRKGEYNCYNTLMLYEISDEVFEGFKAGWSACQELMQSKDDNQPVTESEINEMIRKLKSWGYHVSDLNDFNKLEAKVSELEKFIDTPDPVQLVVDKAKTDVLAKQLEQIDSLKAKISELEDKLYHESRKAEETTYRYSEFVSRMKDLGQAMPPNAISMNIQKALARLEGLKK